MKKKIAVVLSLLSLSTNAAFADTPTPTTPVINYTTQLPYSNTPGAGAGGAANTAAAACYSNGGPGCIGAAGYSNSATAYTYGAAGYPNAPAGYGYGAAGYPNAPAGYGYGAAGYPNAPAGYGFGAAGYPNNPAGYGGADGYGNGAADRGNAGAPASGAPAGYPYPGGNAAAPPLATGAYPAAFGVNYGAAGTAAPLAAPGRAIAFPAAGANLPGQGSGYRPQGGDAFAGAILGLGPQPQPFAPGNPAAPQVQGDLGGPYQQKAAAALAPSALETSMSQDTVPFDKSLPQQFKVGPLTQFGYSFFRPDAVGFAPQYDVPVGPDYLIGAGDHLVITIWGSIEGSFDVEVNRNGEVVLPKVGAVKVEGTSFGQLPGLLRANLGRILKDFHLNVTMGKLRLIKVYLVGEVTAPGDYTISSLSTVINALSAAGGPNKNGSLRNIQIKRNGRLVETVDLYDFFLKGDKGKDIRLHPGDTVLVPVIGTVAGITGNVRRPGIYELKEEKSLKDLLQLADGINPTGYLQRVQLLRVQSNRYKMVSDLNLDPKDGKSIDQMAGGVPLKELDLVKVFPIATALRGYLRLDGYLLRPGDYAFKPGMKLSSLLGRDNLLPEYYAKAGQITRLYPPDYHPEVIFFDVAKALDKEPAADLELKEFDSVHLFSRWEMEEMPTARISGEVQHPGIYRLFDNMTIRDLLILSGNVKHTAYLKNAEITRIKRSGERVTSYSIIVNLADALKGGADNLKLEPYDELTVRRLPNWAEETDRYITLKGEFVFPGVYPIYKGEHLSSVIRRAGGFTEKAYLPAAKFTRVQVQELQQKRMDELLSKAESDITKKQGELASTSASAEELAANKAALDALMKSTQMLKQKKAEGRLVMRLAPPDKLQQTPFDVEAMGGDLLEVPPNPQMVSVLGQVYNPTSFVYQSGEEVAKYLKQAGGANGDADTDEMYLVKADGSVVSRRATGSFLGIGGFLSKKVDSGDTIVVPQQTEHTAIMRDVKDIATILGQLAITAGVIIATGL
jgi:polysaccharide biosynthesis/export protein